MSDHGPLPVTDDPDTGPFFTAISRGDVMICICSACRRPLHMPVRHCADCGAEDPTWIPVRPTGRLYSFTVVEHQVHPDFPVPHTIVLVALDDHPDVRLLGHLPGRHELEIDQAMIADFDTGSPVLRWRPETTGRND